VTRLPAFVVLLLLPGLATCASKGVDCSDVVFTPAGPVARDCVHQVPNGATLSTGDGGVTIVSVNGQVVATYPPCPCPHQVGPPDGSSAD
jgi:hypothetical protein